MSEMPTWKATVEHKEIEFGPLNDAAKEAARENVEYPWGQPLVEASKVRERLLSDEAVEQVVNLLPRFTDDYEIPRAREIVSSLAAAFPPQEEIGSTTRGDRMNFAEEVSFNKPAVIIDPDCPPGVRYLIQPGATGSLAEREDIAVHLDDGTPVEVRSGSEKCICPYPDYPGAVRANCPVHDPHGNFHPRRVKEGARRFEESHPEAVARFQAKEKEN